MKSSERPLQGDKRGRTPPRQCRDSLNSIWDAKITLNDQGVGKVFKYVQLAGQKCKNYKGDTVPIRGVAFDAEKMMLITGLGDKIHHVVVLRMAAAGSRQHLVEFLCKEHDEWAAPVKRSCTALEVSLGRINLDSNLESQILLGAGGYGRAYRLEEGALKISLGRSMGKEYELMQKAYEWCPDIVVRPLRYHEETGEDGEVLFSAYTMADCGEAVARPSVESVAMRKSLATALFRLHAAGLVHGDPRVENIVMMGTSLKWIDFYESFICSEETKTARRKDVFTLLRSVLGEDADISTSKVNAYVEDCTLDALKSLMLF
jgi:tRNA A-37 threonylcarbamoyl transferase component Bud32